MKRLTDHQVEFVLIGAFAAMAHGVGITTLDIDVCAPLVRPNVDRIIAALRDLHPYFRFRPATARIDLYDDPERLVGWKNIYLMTDLCPLDILGELPDVASYEQVAANSIEADFESFKCRMIDLDTLILAKRAANRPKDQIHLRHLEALRKRLQNPPQ